MSILWIINDDQDEGSHELWWPLIFCLQLIFLHSRSFWNQWMIIYQPWKDIDTNKNCRVVLAPRPIQSVTCLLKAFKYLYERGNKLNIVKETLTHFKQPQKVKVFGYLILIQRFKWVRFLFLGIWLNLLHFWFHGFNFKVVTIPPSS